MALRFYNSLTQQLEPFAPQDGRTVRMYCCGPTVYHYAHIGNLRTFTFQDILRRWLRSSGFALDNVMNITDVDDKIIRAAMGQSKTLREYTAEYEAAFLEDMATLRLERPEHVVRATEHIGEMVELIQQLGAKGFTYESDGSTYYRIARFPEYGKLSHNDFGGMIAGARVDVDEYDKDDARDFVLWKQKKEGEPSWDTPIGDGRPGWHIECSAMAMKYLGSTLDIHAGGIDLQFPHHENEIAQSEAVTGKQFARFWLHAEHLIVEGQKMSKSLGNFYTLRDLLALGYAPETVRYLLASVPYRNKLNFTMDGLKAAATAIERLRNFELRLRSERFADDKNAAATERAAAATARFREAMDDDLNTAGALGVIFEFLRDTNSAMDAGQFGIENAHDGLVLLSLFDRVFDVLRPTATAGGLSDDAVAALVAERVAAKKARNFARADEIRASLDAQGIVLEDTKDGTRWKRK
ncbi:MAG: cysteine--tRNA ligase [Acidobacteriota bacterium]|jgi:cysteinyl-tRNA synthetase|nr:cysteine--tRNA ligase [Acidobacteriaceae bacterium]